MPWGSVTKGNEEPSADRCAAQEEGPSHGERGDEDQDERVILGVNVAESDQANTAVRINAVYLDWINSINK